MAGNLKLRKTVISHTEDTNTIVFLSPTLIEISDTPFFVTRVQ
jgi:hypothetical protein